jgi:hypothetical protein
MYSKPGGEDLKTTNSDEKLIHLIKEHAEPRVADLLRRYYIALKAGRFNVADVIHKELQFYHASTNMADFVSKSHSNQENIQPLNKEPMYLLSSVFMERLRAYQQTRPPEQVVGYLTGYIDPSLSIRIPFEIIDLQLNNKAMYSAEPSLMSISDALNMLESKAHPLLAIVHSHFGKGPMATSPSGTDLTTIRTLEQSYGSIGIIFDGDGSYFRCFSMEQKFAVKLVGKGIKEVSSYDGDIFQFE